MTTGTTPEAGGQESTTTVCALDGGRALLVPDPASWVFDLADQLITTGPIVDRRGRTLPGLAQEAPCGCLRWTTPAGGGPLWRCVLHPKPLVEPCRHEWVEVLEGGLKGRPWFRCRRCSAERRD